MRTSLLWLLWLVLPVFALAYHYGPGQVWLARDQAAVLIKQAERQSAAATIAQESAYAAQLRLLDARRAAFVAGIDWQNQPQHPLAQAVQTATDEQNTAYDQAAELWHATAARYGEATETLLKVVNNRQSSDTVLPASDRRLLEALRWAEARAMVRSGEVFNGIEQLQALLDLRVSEANQRAASAVQLTSAAGRDQTETNAQGHGLPTDAIREELAAAQYVGARLLREEGRPPEVWRPVANAARQHYRYLSSSINEATIADDTVADDTVADDTVADDTVADDTVDNLPPNAEPPALAAQRAAADTDLDRGQRMQRNLEQVLNLEQSDSDQLEGLPLPRSAPLARRPGDGEPGNKPGKQPGRGPLQDGPPAAGAGIPGPSGPGW